MILFKKLQHGGTLPQKFQISGKTPIIRKNRNIDNVSDATAETLGITYVGNHPRAGVSEDAAVNRGTIVRQGGSGTNQANFINAAGQNVNAQYEEKFKPRSINRVNDINAFNTSASALHKLGYTGAQPLTRQAGFDFTEEFANRNSVEGLADDFVIGNLTDEGNSYPVTNRGYRENKQHYKNIYDGTGTGTKTSRFTNLNAYYQ